MRTIRSPLQAVYIRNKQHRNPNTFELQANTAFEFEYVVMSSPQSNYLKKVGAVYVLDCWHKKTKLLHTGLLHFHGTWYFGDNVMGASNKKDLIIVNINNLDSFTLFLFPDFDPKRKVKFVECFAIKEHLKTNSIVS